MTAITDDLVTVPYNYMWAGEMVGGDLTLAKAMLAGES